MASDNYVEVNDIQKIWQDACSNCEVSGVDTKKWWEIIHSRYSEKTRHYHTLKHIGHMLWLMNTDQTVSNNILDSTSMTFAVFFHDLIYDPLSKENEDKSAEAFSSFFKEANVQSVECSVVVDYIAATKTHSTDEHKIDGNWGATDLHLFLDLDMAILSVNPVEYNLYATNIRKEYSHFAEDVYCKGRAQVLENFLSHRVYCCQDTYKTWENNARHNISTEITKLRHKLM
ncbi:uncharacterized protein [Dysidea avara]|uniref:uncharacterized protein n=1 Tax=Dysidea avara TaxID=196820 RepID=UPI00331F6659